MRPFTIALLLSLLLLTACGGGSGAKVRTDVIDGTWTSTFSGTAPTYNFHATLTSQSSGNMLNVDLGFDTPVFCFGNFKGTSGTFNSAGVVNGNITGQITLAVTTLFPGPDQNVLTIQGNVNGGRITGTWVVTGNVPGVPAGTCPLDSGSFTMTKTG